MCIAGYCLRFSFNNGTKSMFLVFLFLDRAAALLHLCNCAARRFDRHRVSVVNCSLTIFAIPDSAELLPQNTWTVLENRRTKHGINLRFRSRQFITGDSNRRTWSLIWNKSKSFFRHIECHQTLEKIIQEGKVEGQRNRGRSKISWDVEDRMGASVWRVGRTAEDRPMYGISITTATSGNG